MLVCLRNANLSTCDPLGINLHKLFVIQYRKNIINIDIIVVDKLIS